MCSVLSILLRRAKNVRSAAIHVEKDFLITFSVVPSFNSKAPTTFFSFITLTMFSFSHRTTIKHIFRNVILSKTVEKRNNLTHERSTDEKYIHR